MPPHPSRSHRHPRASIAVRCRAVTWRPRWVTFMTSSPLRNTRVRNASDSRARTAETDTGPTPVISQTSSPSTQPRLSAGTSIRAMTFFSGRTAWLDRFAPRRRRRRAAGPARRRLRRPRAARSARRSEHRRRPARRRASARHRPRPSSRPAGAAAGCPCRRRRSSGAPTAADGGDAAVSSRSRSALARAAAARWRSSCNGSRRAESSRSPPPRATHRRRRTPRWPGRARPAPVGWPRRSAVGAAAACWWTGCAGPVPCRCRSCGRCRPRRDLAPFRFQAPASSYRAAIRSTAPPASRSSDASASNTSGTSCSGTADGSSRRHTSCAAATTSITSLQRRRPLWHGLHHIELVFAFATPSRRKSGDGVASESWTSTT